MRSLVLLFAIALGCAPAATSLAQPTPGREEAPRSERPDAAASRRSSSPRSNPDEPGGEERGTQPGGSERAARARENKVGDVDIVTAPVQELRRATRHSLSLGGRVISYTATAGTLTLRDDDGKPIASMFYVAYVADHGPGPARRPVTFFYNGGPGSSSMWLHMGSFSPVRIRTASPAATPAAPFDLVPNQYSLLDKTDMVFLDMIGAGYSRPLGDAKGSQFWGVDQDVDAFARGITRYVSQNNRWDSPKFLFGESYGTTRSAALVYALQQQGMQVNGVLLLSSILNYGVRDQGFDQLYVTLLPSYAATAWYHNRLANRPADLETFTRQVRDFARGPYAAALAKGDGISPAEQDAVARQMSAYIGIAPQILRQSDLRLDLGRFRKELLRDQRRTVGRLDSRFTGIDVDAGGESPEFDPADTGVSGAFVGAFNAYVRSQLGYWSDLQYRPTYYVVGPQWDWKHRPPGSRSPSTTADVALDLSAAMRENPNLKVYSLNGYFDLATPFFGAEYDLAHMQLDPQLRGNLRFAYYPSGHMVYLHEDSLRRMKADVARFYDEALGR